MKAAAASALLAGLLLTGAVAAQAAGTRPPIPPGGREVAPGQIPHPCTAGETISQGYYFSSRAQQWVGAPYCYGKWGNLDASGSQIAGPGSRVTVTAIPNGGSNSGHYAPATASIQWQYPGKVVSGCGPTDLSCTVVPTMSATSEWQWFEFHVSMPRTFFIDSPGDLCGGAHLCAGARTNAWSWVGIYPAGAGILTDPASGGGPPGVLVLAGALALAATAVAVAVRSGRARRLARQATADMLRAGKTAPGIPTGLVAPLAGGAAAGASQSEIPKPRESLYDKPIDFNEPPADPQLDTDVPRLAAKIRASLRSKGTTHAGPLPPEMSGGISSSAYSANPPGPLPKGDAGGDGTTTP